ncbi:MAG: hypothetical protein IPH59_16860 [bacterium]|nr:hypothetical protein [bacterium]
MFLQKKFIGSAAILLLFAAAAFVSSCSTSPDGPVPPAEKPIVKIVNIPASGSHFTNSPVINWYGTDVDGYIVAYQHAVVTAEVLLAASIDTSDAAQLRAYAAANIELPGPNATCVPACWTIVDVERSDSPTRQEVRLVAGNTPADTVVQFFFVRAIDNDSVASEIEFSIYSRNNNPPETEITTSYERGGFFDLPDTSAAYVGISFDWKGSDKIDFPSDTDQPEFDFFYQVFGPYNKSDLDFDTLTGKFRNDFKIDTNQVAEKLVLSSQDPNRGGVWVQSTSARVFNLWRNAPVADTTREGYFVIKVTARDDASAPDPVPDFRVFRAIYPRFEKRVLLYAREDCALGPSPGEIPCLERSDGINVYRWAEINEYYRRIFVNAGYTDVDTTRVRPTKLQIAKYKLIVMLGDGWTATYGSDDYAGLTTYMDLGGSVWVWSTSPFGGTTATAEQLNNFSPNSVPIRYFRVTGEYRDGWVPRYIFRSLGWAPTETDTVRPENLDQFVGGLALAGTGLEDFDVNLEKVQMTFIFKRGADQTNWYDEVFFRGAPHTNYFVRDVLSTPLYLYKSHFGGNIPDDFKRWIKPLHGTVIAVRQENVRFKSAVFGFGAWSVEEDDAVNIVTKMCDWFLN